MSNPPADTSTNATLLQFNKIGAIIYVDMTWTTIGVSLLQIVLFGVLVWWLESPPALGKRNTLQNTFTPINTLLLVMILANLINIGLYYAFTQVSELTTKAALITISNAAWSTISVSMLYYSWYRGFSVVDSIAPRWMNLLRSILAISLILQIANTALASVYNLLPASNPIHTAALNWDNAIFVATGVLLIFFDFFTIMCYILYLWEIEGDNFNIDTEQLKIIARYGILSNICTLLWQLSNGLLLYIQWDYYDETNDDGNLFLNAFFNLEPLLYIFIQLWMKVALHWNKVAIRDRHRYNLSEARRISNQIGFNSNQNQARKTRTHSTDQEFK